MSSLIRLSIGVRLGAVNLRSGVSNIFPCFYPTPVLEVALHNVSHTKSRQRSAILTSYANQALTETGDQGLVRKLSALRLHLTSNHLVSTPLPPTLLCKCGF